MTNFQDSRGAWAEAPKFRALNRHLLKVLSGTQECRMRHKSFDKVLLETP